MRVQICRRASVECSAYWFFVGQQTSSRSLSTRNLNAKMLRLRRSAPWKNKSLANQLGTARAGPHRPSTHRKRLTDDPPWPQQCPRTKTGGRTPLTRGDRGKKPVLRGVRRQESGSLR